MTSISTTCVGCVGSRSLLTLQTGHHTVAVNASESITSSNMEQWSTIHTLASFQFITCKAPGSQTRNKTWHRTKVPAATLNETYLQGFPTNISELDQNNTGADPGHKRSLLTSWTQVETAALRCGWQHASSSALVLFFLGVGAWPRTTLNHVCLIHTEAEVCVDS